MPRSERICTRRSPINWEHRNLLNVYLLDVEIPRRSKIEKLRQYITHDGRFVELAYYAMLISIGSYLRNERSRHLLTVVAPTCTYQLLKEANDYYAKEKSIHWSQEKYDDTIDHLTIFVEMARRKESHIN